MEQIYANGHIPIIVGGTGFYIQALLYDIDFTSTSQDDNYRQDLENLAKEKGAEYLHNMLREIDPKSAEDIHANNIKRVIRALEYYHQTGQKMSMKKSVRKSLRMNLFILFSTHQGNSFIRELTDVWIR